MEQTTSPAADPPEAGAFERAVVRLVPAGVSANHISIFRIIGTLVIMGLEFAGTRAGLILIIAVVTGLSDFLDGMVARVRRQTSELGAFLDPLGDKLFALALGIMVWRRGWVDPHLLLGLLALETHALILPAMSMLRRKMHKRPLWPPPKVRPNWWGKWKTALLGGALGLVILGEVSGLAPLAVFGRVVIWISLGVGLIAYILYFRDWARGAYW